MVDDLVEHVRKIVSEAENVDTACEQVAAYVRSLYPYEPDEFVVKVPAGPALMYVSGGAGSERVTYIDHTPPSGGFMMERRDRAILVALLRHTLEQWESDDILWTGAR